MDDERCRITVVGGRRRVDLAVPARAPIAEYVADLGRLCGQETDETLPAAWSLAPAGGRPYPLTTSLLEAQVVDGATLYLRDVLEGEADGPLVTDIEEIVEEESGRWDRWSSRHRAMTLIGLGLAGLLAALAALILRAPGDPLAALVAIFAGCVLILVAGAAVRGGWKPPGPLRVAVALSACPALGLAGHALAATGGVGAAVAGATVGAAVGAVAAVIAVPHEASFVVGLAAAVALPVAIVLAWVDARPVESAALVGVVALMALGTAPTLAGRLVTLVPAWVNAPAPDPVEEIAASMRRGRRVLITLALLSCLAAAGSLPVLAASDDWWAVALALCLSLALMAQAGQSAVPVAIMPAIAAGAVGLFALAIEVPGLLLDAGPLTPALAVCGVAAAVLAIGFALAAQPERTPDERPSWIVSWGVLLSVLSVPLAVGVFGVFGYLVDLGGRL